MSDKNKELIQEEWFKLRKDWFSIYNWASLSRKGYSEEIAKLEKKHNDLKFLYTGPWPPYSFVNINVAGS